jgi:hypothetical protein
MLGTLVLFEEFSKYIADGSHDMNSDTFKVMLIDNTLVATASLATPDSSDFTEVTGTGYTAGGEALTTPNLAEVGGVTTFDDTGAVSVGWFQNGAGPQDIYQAILYNVTHSGSNDAIAFVDMTTDGGTTPADLQAGDVTITWGASGIFTITI